MGIRATATGKYEASVQIHGQRHYGTFETKTGARDFIARVRSESADGNLIAPTDARTLLRDWLDTWLELRRPAVAEGTYTRYESIVRLHLKPALGSLPLAAVQPDVVQSWVNDVAADQGPAAAHSQLPILRAALTTAMKQRKVRVNAATLVDLPKYTSDEMTFLEPGELQELVAGAEDWVADVILGLAFTGARFGELAALTPADVNPLKGTITLRASKQNGKPRTIPIAEPIRDVVARRLEAGTERVFTAPTWNKLHIATFRNRYWYPLVEESEIGRHVRPHDLRHTCASWLIHSGHNPVQVCRWLGHKNPTQTLNTYAHLFDVDMDDMAASLERLWSKPADETTVTAMREAE